MKKIIIALCAVAMAVGAQAGSIKWSVSAGGAKGWNGTTETTLAAESMTIYFLRSADMASVETALKKGDDFSSYILDSGKNTGANGAKSTSGQITRSNSVLPLVENPPDSGMYDGVNTAFRILVVQDNVGENKDTWYKFSGEVSKKTYWEGAETPVPTTASFTSTAWGKGTTWQKIESVPEPTSAMLLLLGVAGLALKRKRA